MKLSVIVCDVCKDQSRDAKTYQVTSDGRKASTDRCQEHGALFEDVLVGAAETSSAKPRTTRRRGRVTTLEEIEASKAGK